MYPNFMNVPKFLWGRGTWLTRHAHILYLCFELLQIFVASLNPMNVLKILWVGGDMDGYGRLHEWGG